MKCPSCGSENREGAKFCGECAASLVAALACPSCGTANPKGRKFCDSCGQPLAELSAPDPRSYTPKHLAEKILTSRAALEGERKQVTVLFADLKGSMDLGEKVDPEEWYRIMDRRWRIEPALAEAEAWLEMSDAKSYEPACIWSAPSWPV